MSNAVTGNNLLKRFIFYHLPALIYAGLIIAVSSIPNLKPPRIINLHFDKVAHFLEYAVLAFLVFRSAINLNSTINRTKAFLIAAAFVAAFALIDELYQKSVAGRDSSLGDLVVDLAGSALVLILLWYRGKTRKSAEIDGEQ
jgi:VanZ family protein